MTEIVTFENKKYKVEYEKLAPSIFVYKNALPKEMRIIERVENALAIPNTRFQWEESMDRANIEDPTKLEHYNLQVSQRVWEPRDEFSSDVIDLNEEIIHALKVCLEHYKPANYLSDISYIEEMNIIKYTAGHYFRVHSDDTDFYRCTVSVVGYPNDDYEGGEISFPGFDLTYKPQAGDLLLFPSSFAYAHLAEPVIGDGVKYTLAIMTDRNAFANRKDSPILYDGQLLAEHGFQIHGMNNDNWRSWKKIEDTTEE